MSATISGEVIRDAAIANCTLAPEPSTYREPESYERENRNPSIIACVEVAREVINRIASWQNRAGGLVLLDGRPTTPGSSKIDSSQPPKADELAKMHSIHDETILGVKAEFPNTQFLVDAGSLAINGLAATTHAATRYTFMRITDETNLVIENAPSETTHSSNDKIRAIRNFLIPYIDTDYMADESSVDKIKEQFGGVVINPFMLAIDSRTTANTLQSMTEAINPLNTPGKILVSVPESMTTNPQGELTQTLINGKYGYHVIARRAHDHQPIALNRESNSNGKQQLLSTLKDERVNICGVHIADPSTTAVNIIDDLATIK